MNPVGRTWELWGYRFEDGELWHVGERNWVELHRLRNPELHQESPVIVPVLVEEILGDPYNFKVTHYGWRHEEGGGPPTMIQGADFCFLGRSSAIERGDVVALLVTERTP